MVIAVRPMLAAAVLTCCDSCRHVVTAVGPVKIAIEPVVVAVGPVVTTIRPVVVAVGPVVIAVGH